MHGLGCLRRAQVAQADHRDCAQQGHAAAVQLQLGQAAQHHAQVDHHKHGQHWPGGSTQRSHGRHCRGNTARCITVPEKGNVCISVKDGDKERAVAVARDLVALGFGVVATKGTAAAIAAAGVPVKPVNKVKDGRPHISDAIKAGEIQLVFTTVDETRTAIADSRSIRQAALANRVTYYTTMAGCEAAVEAMKHQDDLVVYSLQELHAKLN